MDFYMEEAEVIIQKAPRTLRKKSREELIGLPHLRDFRKAGQARS